MPLRNNGEWSDAKYQSFIKSGLRTTSVRWPPRYLTLHEACVGTKTNVKTGRLAKHYTCNECKLEFPAKDVQVNHKEPVIPLTGFVSWDDVIERLFCEKEGLEVLCKPCHKTVTKQENDKRKEYKTDAKCK